MKYTIDAIIEVPLNTRNKFEIDESTGKIKLDRVLYSAMRYPCEYGYIDDSLALDGDPLDILVITSEPTFPGCIVPARVIGFLEVIDRGYEDYKLISVVDVDPRYNEIQSLHDLSSFTLKEIKDFFKNYKTLQNMEVIVKDYHSKEEAIMMIEICKERFKRRKELDKLVIKSVKMKIIGKDNNHVKAICNVKFDNEKTIQNIELIDSNGKLFISTKNADIEDALINRELRNTLEKIIITKYKEITTHQN